MGAPLVWISGATSGIGRAMAESVPWEGARVVNISRRPAEGAEHLEADLCDPSSWARVGAAFRRELSPGATDGAAPERVAFVHAAGSVDPIGFAAEVDSDAYARNVLLNSAASQVLGQMFLAAARDLPCERQLVMFTSGAARSIYPGWTAYGAAKAAVDQWVRDAGAEQKVRGGIGIISIAPGQVDTPMQARLREMSEDDFPQRQKFVEAYQKGKLTDPGEVARTIWDLLGSAFESGSVVDLRELAAAGGG